MNVRVVWSLQKGAIVKLDCFDTTSLMLKAVTDISESSQVIREDAENAFIAGKCALVVLSL